MSSHLFAEMSLPMLAGLNAGYYLEHMPRFNELYGHAIEPDAEGFAVVSSVPGRGVSFNPSAVQRFAA
jgi:hypothetical protein